MLSRKVLRLTKPKGKIYKTKSLGHYITDNVLYFDIIVSEFKLQLPYYVHFRLNTLVKGMNTFIYEAMGVVYQRKLTTLMYKCITCFFSFPFSTRNVRMSRTREWVEEGWDEPTKARYKSPVNHFFFVLLSQDWHRATSRHRISLVSPRFSTFTSLEQGLLKALNHLTFSSILYFHKSYKSLSRHRISLVSPRFSTFTSLEQGLLKALNHLTFSSILYFHKSYKSLSRHWIILVSPRFSTFTSIVQVPLKAPNHLTFSSILYFHKSRTRPSQGTESPNFRFSTFTSLVQGLLKALNHLTFSSILYFHKSYKSLSRHRISLVSPRFSTFTSLEQSLLKALNHLTFSSILYFPKSRTRPSQRTESPNFRFSTFTSLVQGLLKALNHLTFSSLLYFHESRTSPSQGTESAYFLLASLLSRVSYKSLSRHRISLVSLRFSTFTSLVQVPLKPPNHISFSSLLYFHESRTGPSQSTESFNFYLLFYFHTYCTAQSFFCLSTLDILAQGRPYSHIALFHQSSSFSQGPNLPWLI